MGPVAGRTDRSCRQVQLAGRVRCREDVSSVRWNFNDTV